MLQVGILSILTFSPVKSFADTCVIYSTYDLTKEIPYYHYRFLGDDDKSIDVVVNNADKNSFVVMDNYSEDYSICSQYMHDYARDKRHVFYRGKVIEKASPESFLLINYNYARDKNSIYGESQFITNRVNDFRVLSDSYATDGEHYFYGDEVLDGTEFKLLTRGYAKTETSVYKYGKKLDGVDATTFEILDGGIMRDKNHVFLNDQPILKADPITFRQISGGYFRDKRAVYNEGKEILGSDPETFVSLGGVFAKDKLSAYLFGEAINEADLETIKAVSYFVVEDKNFRYELSSCGLKNSISLNKFCLAKSPLGADK